MGHLQVSWRTSSIRSNALVAPFVAASTPSFCQSIAMYLQVLIHLHLFRGGSFALVLCCWCLTFGCFSVYFFL